MIMELGIFVNEGNQQIKLLRFTQSAINFGRSQSCHLVLQDEMLAEQHGSIFWSDGHLFVGQAGSHLMIKVNDLMITGPTQIMSNDIISFGQTLMP